MTPEEFEQHRHECEVRDVLRRIKEQPKTEREAWFAKYIGLVIEKRGVDAGDRLYQDVLRANLATQPGRAA